MMQGAGADLLGQSESQRPFQQPPKSSHWTVTSVMGLWACSPRHSWSHSGCGSPGMPVLENTASDT